MAHDEELAATLRAALAEQKGITEKRMFGGLCFLLGGNMLCTTSGDGGMYRVGAENEAEALSLPGVAPTVMGTRRMRGFVSTGAEGITDAALRGRLLGLALGFVSHLPPK